MKNSEIHVGLDKKEIRDFLSLSMVKAYDEEFANKKEEIPYKENCSFQWAIREAEAQVKYFQRSIEILKQKEATNQLICSNGWKEFDVSDVTEKDLPYRLKMNFIGTNEEYNKFFLQIEDK